MRIMIVASPWLPVPPLAYGGTETVLDALARGLDGAGHDVLLFTSGDSSCPVPRASHFAKAVGIGGPDAELSEIRHVIAAYEEAKDFDIVHDHTVAGPIYAAGFSNRAVVTTNHGPFDDGLGQYYRAVSKRIPVIAISHAQAASATGVRVAGVIHHGLDVEAFREGDGQGGYALFLGRMAPGKGVHTAAQVALTAGVPLVIAGKCSEASEIAYFEEQVKPLLGQGIEFVGEVDRRTKLDLLGRARCLLNPIAWPEPFGMVMVEALASGTPVVATHCGAAPEIVDDGVTGLLADDHMSLVDAVLDVGAINRTLCRKVAAERFSIDQMVSGHLAVYETIMKAHAVPSR